MRLFLALALALSPLAALAQQPQQQPPTQMALQINSIVASWAITLEAWQKQLADLQRANADLRKQLADLRAKEPPKK